MGEMADHQALIRKRDVEFWVADPDTRNWFLNSMHRGTWEEQTFEIIDRFASQSKTYVDIGSWVGPTLLYAARKYEKAVGCEPDPVAYTGLLRNLRANPDMENVSVANCAIDSVNGRTVLYGKPQLGGSGTTALAPSKAAEKAYAVSMQLSRWMDSEWVNPSDIGLIKVDIEGAELHFAADTDHFLKKYQPPLLLSLHWMYLNEIEIRGVVENLTNVYHKCFTPQSDASIKADDVLLNKHKSLVFV